MKTAPPRARLPTEERRAQLLAVGLRLFAETPYEDVAIDDVAAEVGISKGLLYHYFPSKRDFYIATLRAAADDLMERTRPTVAPTIDTLREGLLISLDYIEKNATGYKTLMRCAVGSDPEVLAIVEGVRQASMDRILLAIDVPRPPPLLRLALRGWIGFVEQSILHWLDHKDVSKKAQCELFAETLVHVLMAAGRPVR